MNNLWTSLPPETWITCPLSGTFRSTGSEKEKELYWEHGKNSHGPNIVGVYTGRNFRISPDPIGETFGPNPMFFYLQMCHRNLTRRSTFYYSSPNAARYALFKICHNYGVIQMGSHTVMVSEEQYGAIGRQACSAFLRNYFSERSVIKILYNMKPTFIVSGIQTNSLSPVNPLNKPRTHHTKCTFIPVVTRRSVF